MLMCVESWVVFCCKLLQVRYSISTLVFFLAIYKLFLKVNCVIIKSIIQLPVYASYWWKLPQQSIDTGNCGIINYHKKIKPFALINITHYKNLSI